MVEELTDVVVEEVVDELTDVVRPTGARIRKIPIFSSQLILLLLDINCVIIKISYSYGLNNMIILIPPFGGIKVKNET